MSNNIETVIGDIVTVGNKLVVKTPDGEISLPMPRNLPATAGVGDKVTLRCRINPHGGYLLVMVSSYKSKDEIEAERQRREAEIEEQRRQGEASLEEWKKSVEVRATISWRHEYDEGGHGGKRYGQNLKRFVVRPEEREYFWLDIGAERLLLEVVTHLQEEEEMLVVLTYSQGQFVPGSMRRP